MSAEEGLKRLARAKAGDVREFSRFLSWLERVGPRAAFELPELLKPARRARRIGLTGPPGAGKSTLTAGLITRYRALNKKIGVIAVDPSSPFSRGAILGDRIRYAEHTLDDHVFIRSLGTRGSLGGLSGGAFLMARAFDACGFDVLLIETVGVGQTEFDVLHVADVTCVTLVPESGDAIQAMKAGLLEIADVFNVNKADRPGADSLAREIEASRDEHVKVFKTIATNGSGVDELAAELLARPTRVDRDDPVRLREEAKALRRLSFEAKLNDELAAVSNLETFVHALVD